MAFRALFVVAMFAAVALAAEQNDGVWDVNACTFSYGRNSYDFSALKKPGGSYIFTQPTFNAPGNNLYTPDPSMDLLTFTWVFNICENANVTQFSACDGVPAAPVYQLSSDNKTCTAMGDLRVTAFNPNPFKNGVNMLYYHGQYVDNVQSYTSRFYMICDATTDMSGLKFEHQKSFYENHITFNTKYACPQ